jgi:exosortase H (IPTLxxWG-CTERM-specific)
LVWRFALSFLGLALLFAILVRIDEAVFDAAAAAALTRRVAQIVATMLRLCGAPVTESGGTVFYQASAFQILADCTGVEFIGLFTAAVLAFPSSWRQRLRALAVGIPVLMGLNLVRMISLILVGVRSQTALEYGHLYVWPVLLLAASLAMWLSWARKAARDPRLLA